MSELPQMPTARIKNAMMRYEDLRRRCLAYGNLHPESKEVCHQAIQGVRCLDGLSYQFALLLDDVALAFPEISATLTHAITQEREACAKLCETFEPKDDVDSGPEFAAAIRARNST